MTDLQCPARLILTRHAEADYVETWFSDEGGSLSALGRRQAVELADGLAAERVAAVWCSDLSRAVQTAEIVAARLGVGVTARKSLRESYVGDLIGAEFDLGALAAVTDRWLAGDLAAAFPGGDSGAVIVQRYRDELTSIADLHRGETVLVVGHQTALATTLTALCGIPPARARLDHCQTLALRADSGGLHPD